MSKTNTTSVNAILCGTGEYTTGYVHNKGSQSDKKVGVVGLCMFELRRLGHVADISMVGTTGKKFEGIRKHLKKNIEDVYEGLDVTTHTFPADDVERDVYAYQAALDTLHPGDIATIFTPDPTHFEIAKYAIERGIHVLVTKPAVMTLAHHKELVKLAKKHNVLVMVEFHKRWDPIYTDARARARALGGFSFFTSFMSQPKFQLNTFKAWAGTLSDISYYLNSHHIDMHSWMMEGRAVPIRVVASASTGVAESEPYNCPKGTEDSITLMTTWRMLDADTTGTAVYTASWAAPKSDVHSQQRFHLMTHKGDINVDQAHRGYYVASDDSSFASVNPLYMSYAPSPDGHFNGHSGYGYKSIEAFVKAAQALNNKEITLDELNNRLPTLESTETTTAILEAGRISLDEGTYVDITYSEESGYNLVVGDSDNQHKKKKKIVEVDTV
eukprot:m.31195 g.31195  ORF g.31195 m.31195 type:complete len:441 (-) comp9686_c0_seq3:52-1374(-)